MTLKKCIGLLAMAAIGGAFAVGCSSSSSGDTGSTTGGNGTDSGTTVKKDSGTGDNTGDTTGGDDSGSGGDTGAASCTPADVSAFVPSWTPPHAPTNQCTQAQVDSYVQCLTDSQTATTTPASCTPWGSSADASHQTCLSCIESKPTDAAWGALIVNGSVISLNIAGCVAAAEGKLDGSGCGGDIQKASECESAACDTNCNGADNTALQACVTAADTGGCATYNTAATNCENAIPDSGAESNCFAGTDFFTALDNIAAIFCVSGTTAGDAATGG